MVFADSEVAVGVSNWISNAIQLGATGILGYFLLKVLPQIQKEVNENQLKMISSFQQQSTADRVDFSNRSKEDRIASDARSASMVSAVEHLADAIPRDLSEKIGVMTTEVKGQTVKISEMTRETKTQTEQLGDMTTEMKELGSRIDKQCDILGSDPAGMCKARMVLKEAGIVMTDEQIDKIIDKLQRARPHK